MDADKSATAPDEAFECRALVPVQHFARGVHENDHPVTRQICIGKGAGIFTRIDVETIPLSKRADGIYARGNGIVAKARSLAEDENGKSTCNLGRLRLG